MGTDAEDMKAELEKLRAENETLKKTKEKGLSMKIGEKGWPFCVWARSFSGNALQGTVDKIACNGR